jgi:thioredoxin-related protein
MNAVMFSRRRFVKTALGAGVACAGLGGSSQLLAASRYEPVMGEDGVLTQPWFMNTFLILPDDLKELSAQGKRLAVFWEQRGCPYCREMHLVNLAKPQIADYVRQHFGVLQLNISGAREVTDFDGQVLGEKEFSQKSRVRFTPTIQFFPDTLAKTQGKPGVEVEVARIPGYFRPFHFLSMFEFVYEKAYARTSFQAYLQEKLAALNAKGLKPEVE